MTLFSTLAAPFKLTQLFDAGHPRDPALARWWGNPPTASGERVTEVTVLTLSAFYSGIRFYAETIGAMPLHVFRDRDDGGKDKATSHGAYRLLHTEPNRDMTTLVWREMTMFHVLVWGHAYSEIVFDGGGNPREIWPIEPWRVTPRRDKDSRKVEYEVTGETGGTRIIADANMLHVTGMDGKSIITHAAESLGYEMAQQKFGASYFANAARPSGAL